MLFKSSMGVLVVFMCTARSEFVLILRFSATAFAALFSFPIVFVSTSYDVVCVLSSTQSYCVLRALRLYGNKFQISGFLGEAP